MLYGVSILIKWRSVLGNPMLWPIWGASESDVVSKSGLQGGGVIPRPTADQLLFQEMELGALVCYNMATTMGSQGCPAHTVPPAATFNDKAPVQVDTDQWCKASGSLILLLLPPK